MWYVIPFVILLVVLLILKKRESANNDQGSEKSKKTNLKKTNKKTPSRTGRSTTSSSASAAPSTTAASTVKSLDPELKTSIESLIQAENYFSAEAKINQALNQDNSQHELYLYLLDIHLAQKDEFAIKQLINYLRSLGLHDIADQADQKHRQSLTPSQESHVAQSLTASTVASSHTAKNAPADRHAAFDELMDLNTSSSSFDQLKQEPTAALSETPVVTPSVEHKEYDTIEYTPEKKPAPSVEQAQALDFNLNTGTSAESVALSEPTAQAVDVEVRQAPAQEIQALEFSFTPKSEPAPSSTAHLSEDFVFNEKPASTAADTVENEFKLDFDLPKVSEPKPEPAPVALDPVPEFTFSLDTPISADPQILAFETPAFDTSSQPAPLSETSELAHSDDPLAQSFPELLQVNEIQLNLDLAKKYIELGAYESARQLLSQNEAEYSSEQRDISQKLLNQIAS